MPKASSYAAGAPALTGDLFFVARSGANKTLSVADINAFPCSRVFPAVEVPSANPNTIDDYQEGTFTPTITASSGTITTTTGVTGWFRKVAGIATVWTQASVSNPGTGAGFIQYSTPFTATAQSQGAGRETQSTGFMGVSQIAAAAALILCQKYDATTLIAAARTNTQTISYPCA